MMITHSLSAKVLVGLYSIALTVLGVAEATNDHTLILISLMGNATLLIVTVIGAAVSVLNNRKLKTVAPVVQRVEELAKEIDGRMTELQQSRLQTSEARQEVARSEGVQQERTEARERMAIEGTPEAS